MVQVDGLAGSALPNRPRRLSVRPHDSSSSLPHHEGNVFVVDHSELLKRLSGQRNSNNQPLFFREDGQPFQVPPKMPPSLRKRLGKRLDQEKAW